MKTVIAYVHAMSVLAKVLRENPYYVKTWRSSISSMVRRELAECGISREHRNAVGDRVANGFIKYAFNIDENEP